MYEAGAQGFVLRSKSHLVGQWLGRDADGDRVHPQLPGTKAAADPFVGEELGQACGHRDVLHGTGVNQNNGPVDRTDSLRLSIQPAVDDLENAGL